MNASLLHDYIERISNLIGSETRITGADNDLQPIQLHVLYYLSRCNRYSNTPQAVTDYFGLTKGTVSQTIKTLATKGLIHKTPDKTDGRRVHLSLSRAGKKVLEKSMPARTLARVWEHMEEGEQEQLIAAVNLLLQKMQQANGMNAFGVCHTCRFNTDTGDGRYFCELTREVLQPTDITLICREHETPGNASAPDQSAVNE